MVDQYERRLKSFENWPSDFPVNLIALAGLIYTGRDDIVMCPLCEVEFYNWEAGDDPTADHLSYSPHCQFFHDSLFIQRKSPVHTDKITLESRMKTFEDWPVQISQTPKELAEAGFFYTGRGDKVLCFHCGLGLHSWMRNDDVWNMHAKFNAKCEFLQLKNDVTSSIKDMSLPIDVSIKDSVLIEKDETYNDKLLCKVCLENELCVTFMPCKHTVCCSDCSITFDKCIICRRNITSFLKIFIS